MKFTIFGYRIEMYKTSTKAQRLIRFAESQGISLTKVGLIKVLRIIEPTLSLDKAKKEVESLFDFEMGIPKVK